MKVKAKHWLNVEGNWHPAGEEFEVESIAGIVNSVEVIAETAPEPGKETEKAEAKAEAEKPAEAPKRRGRSK